jgi:hypothetical protein
MRQNSKLCNILQKRVQGRKIFNFTIRNRKLEGFLLKSKN